MAIQGPSRRDGRPRLLDWRPLSRTVIHAADPQRRCLCNAGNRLDSDIEELARVAAEFRPALLVVKENERHLRGREPGEIPRILLAKLRRAGLPESSLPPASNSEAEAAQAALTWAREGDVLALPVHSAQARAAVVAMLGHGRCRR